MCGAGCCPGYKTDDIQKLHEELTSRGVNIKQPPEVQPWGASLMKFEDVDGNTFVVTSGD
jgi:uncharacterized glyoxalase superfamily protein PhnB